MIIACKRRALWLWGHRTKIAGGVGFGAGVLQSQLQSHPELILPKEGTLLMILGAVIVAIGTYNSIAIYFGWTGPPTAPP
jgi:hypothetical protein